MHTAGQARLSGHISDSPAAMPELYRLFIQLANHVLSVSSAHKLSYAIRRPGLAQAEARDGVLAKGHVDGLHLGIQLEAIVIALAADAAVLAPAKWSAQV